MCSARIVVRIIRVRLPWSRSVRVGSGDVARNAVDYLLHGPVRIFGAYDVPTRIVVHADTSAEILIPWGDIAPSGREERFIFPYYTALVVVGLPAAHYYSSEARQWI